jgi:ubiquitin C-terminal hydrolase
LNGFVNNIYNFYGGKLTNATIELIKKMINNNNKKENCSASRIKEIMGEISKNYKENEPEDAYEFIVYYLDTLVKETLNESTPMKKRKVDDNDKIYFNQFLKKFSHKYFRETNIKNGGSFILDLFYGLLRTERYCYKCKKSFSVKFNIYNILILPVYNIEGGKTNMEKILIEYFKYSKSNNACDICSKPLYIKTDIFTLPKCLILYFGINYEKSYNSYYINCEEPINMGNFVYKNSNDYNYKLKGIIYHNFIGKKGHYSASCFINNYWRYFDDNYVGLDRRSSNSKPIILFYEKI